MVCTASCLLLDLPERKVMEKDSCNCWSADSRRRRVELATLAHRMWPVPLAQCIEGSWRPADPIECTEMLELQVGIAVQVDIAAWVGTAAQVGTAVQVGIAA